MAAYMVCDLLLEKVLKTLRQESSEKLPGDASKLVFGSKTRIGLPDVLELRLEY